MKTMIFARPVVLLAALAAIAMLALAACGSPSNAYGGGGAKASPSAGAVSGGSTTSRVSIQNFSFAPSTITVPVGTTVTWTNNDTTQHDVTSANGPGTNASTTSTFASGPMAQGDTFSYTFKKAGTYYYECSIHAAMAAMHGVVIVQ